MPGKHEQFSAAFALKAAIRIMTNIVGMHDAAVARRLSDGNVKITAAEMEKDLRLLQVFVDRLRERVR